MQAEEKKSTTHSNEEDEKKKKAIETTLASIKAKTKSISAQTGLQGHKSEKKEVGEKHKNN